MEEGTQVPQRRADTVCGGGRESGEQEADRKKLLSARNWAEPWESTRRPTQTMPPTQRRPTGP